MIKGSENRNPRTHVKSQQRREKAAHLEQMAHERRASVYRDDPELFTGKEGATILQEQRAREYDEIVRLLLEGHKGPAGRRERLTLQDVATRMKCSQAKVSMVASRRGLVKVNGEWKRGQK